MVLVALCLLMFVVYLQQILNHGFFHAGELFENMVDIL
jgi:hypothetical protein